MRSFAACTSAKALQKPSFFRLPAHVYSHYLTSCLTNNAHGISSKSICLHAIQLVQLHTPCSVELGRTCLLQRQKVFFGCSITRTHGNLLAVIALVVPGNAQGRGMQWLLV